MNSINKRLACVAGFINRGSRVVDVGTDHAYLPIFLTKAGICEQVIGTDINDGPCQRARENIKANKLTDKIEIIKADGLKGIGDFKPTDIVIAGMGGELIWQIISESPEYTEHAKLILSPMTKIPSLRWTLNEHGYEIEDEALCYDDRIYQIIVARYTGTAYRMSEIESVIGPRIMEHAHKGECELYQAHIDSFLKKYKKIRREKLLHGISAKHESELISLLKKEKETVKNG